MGGKLAARLNVDLFDYDITGNGKSEPNPYAIALAYDSLLTIEQGPKVGYGQTTLKPRLAASWEVPSDASAFTFHILKNVRFGQFPPVNGRPLTAEDVKWSYEYHSRTGNVAARGLPDASFASMLDGLDGIDTPDPYTAVIRFKQPFAPFLNYSALYALPILPREIFEQDGSFSNRIVGTGPFQLDYASSQKGSRWVFKRNPTYWRAGHPYIDEVDYLVLPDDSSAYAAFKVKQLDVLKAVTDVVAVETIKRDSPAAVAQDYVDPQPPGTYLSVRRPPFNDARLRQAFGFAIDRDEFLKVFTHGGGGWSIPCGFPDSWTQEEIKQVLKYNPDGAKRIVAEAGYPDGLDVVLSAQDASLPISMLELLQAQLKKAAINVTIKRIDKATGSKALHGGDFTIFPTPQTFKGDPDSRLFGSYYSTSPGNYVGLKDPKFDSLVNAERQEADAAKRRDLIKDASRYLAVNGLSFAFFGGTGASFWHPRIKNYADNWQIWDWNAADIWLED
jgi:ABC-type transport system substrate-binding protein